MHHFKAGRVTQRNYIMLLETGTVYRSWSILGELLASYTPSYILKKISYVREGYTFTMNEDQM